MQIFTWSVSALPSQVNPPQPLAFLYRGLAQQGASIKASIKATFKKLDVLVRVTTVK